MVDLDCPWWLADDPPASPPLPWSGEVIPLPAEPPLIPAVPANFPIAGPVIQFIGKGEHAIWDDVWGWVKGTAKSAASDVVSLIDQAAAEAVKIAESYTGAVLQALSGFINDAVDFTQFVAQSAISFGINIADVLYADIVGLELDVYKILEDVVGIEGRLIPELAGEIARLGIDTWDLVGGVAQALRTWAIDTIYDPLAAEIERVDTKIRDDVWNLTGAVAGEIEDMIKSEAATRAAAIAGIAAAVAAIATEITDCVEPMCQSFGPKTDLGKLLKGLSGALDLLALADLLTWTGPELEAKIAEGLTHTAAIVGEFESYFGPGGKTLGGIFAEKVAGA